MNRVCYILALINGIIGLMKFSYEDDPFWFLLAIILIFISIVNLMPKEDK